MADPNTRQGKRTPVTLKIKFKSETLEQFIERYAVDVSQGGIFIRTKEPLAVGTQMKFEFQLRDASPLIAGEGTVVWTRENDPSRPAIAPGMGVRFDRLADGSQAVLERILAEKAKQAPNRTVGSESPTKPPMFTDTPTRVAPAPVQEALGVRHPRPKSDSEQTPLPPPRPFHSDADDFDERAFEEATKVRSLEELAAQTAGLGPAEDPANDAASDEAPTNAAIAVPSDELAARRKSEGADSTASAPGATAAKSEAPAAAASTATVPTERESAPGLPEPPSSPGDSKPADTQPVDQVDQSATKTKLGVEPAKAPTRPASDSAAPRSVPAESSIPTAPPRSSAASIVIFLLVLVAAAAGGVWWFVLRDHVKHEVAQEQDEGSAGSAVAMNPEGSGSAGATGSAGSDGSATAMVQQDGSGSAGTNTTGSDGSAAVEPPQAQMVDTLIAASVSKGATVEIVGTDQKGASPFTAKLEKDKVYSAKVSAPGYVTKQVEVKGGQDKVLAKLSLKPRIINIITDPPGAAIYIDGIDTEKIAPSEVQLSASQALRPRVRISLRRPGFRPVDKIFDSKKFEESESRMTATLTAKLIAIPRPTGDGSAGTTHAGSGSGSATTPSESGSGSAATPSGGSGGSQATPPGGDTDTTGGGTGTTAPSGSGSGTATPGAGSATKAPTSSTTPPASSPSSTATPTASTGEPQPTWAK